MQEKQHRAQGNQDEREKSRKLSPAEERRLRRFEELAEELGRQGYRRVELTVSIVKANVFAALLLIPLLLAGVGLFLLSGHPMHMAFGPTMPFLLLPTLLVLIVVHELLHGLSWALFAERHWKDIEFGFILKYLTPYCSCCAPLSKGQYVFGALMPLAVLGLLPMLVGILMGAWPILMLGILMADAAAGDIIVVWKLLRYKSMAESIIYMDHPTQAGGVVFER